MQLEQNENCIFVKLTGDKHLAKEGIQVQYFQCSCSGISCEVNSPLKKSRRKTQGEICLLLFVMYIYKMYHWKN